MFIIICSIGFFVLLLNKFYLKIISHNVFFIFHIENICSENKNDMCLLYTYNQLYITRTQLINYVIKINYFSFIRNINKNVLYYKEYF